MKQDEYSTANQLWNSGATVVQQLNPGGPDYQAPANLTESFMPAIIKSDDRPTGVQIKRSAKSGLTKSAVCRIHVISYYFVTNDYLPNLIRKITQETELILQNPAKLPRVINSRIKN